jgi:hypothetical protein
MQPRAANAASLAGSFLHATVDSTDPFYETEPCTAPAAWSSGADGACFYDSIEWCNSLFAGPLRPECYCGAMGGAARACTENGRATEPYQTGRNLLDSCLQWADQAQAILK